MKHALVRFGLAVLLWAIVVLPLGARGAKEAEGRTVKIGVMGGQTGPAAASVVPMFEELEHVFRYINEVEGGIDGATIEWRILDNKGTLDGAVMTYRELEGGFRPLFYVIVEDYYYLAIQEDAEADQVAMFTLSALNPQCYLPPSAFFSISLPLSDGFAGFIKWVLEDWKGEGAPRIGALYWDLPSGQQYQMALPWAMKQGVEVVPVQFPIALMDLKPQLLKLQESEVDYIWMMGLTQNAAVAIRDARSLGIAGKIPFVFNEYVEPKVLLELVGAGAAGFYSYRAESPFSDGEDATRRYVDLWKWATDEERWADNRHILTLKAVITAAVKKAAEEAGWDALDRGAFYSALDRLTSVDTWGNTHNFGFGPDKRIGVSAIKMARYTQDGRESVGDWIELPATFEGKAR